MNLSKMLNYLKRLLGCVKCKKAESDETAEEGRVSLQLLKQKLIPFDEILRATKNFSSKLRLGMDVFGSVYQGTLDSGMKVAVKRLHIAGNSHLTALPEWLLALSQVRHSSVVSFIGYCIKISNMMLAFEYMENGTLRDHLYSVVRDSDGTSLRSKLSWEQRLQICIDAAQALHYLHTGCSTRIIHGDFKSTSILLDKNYNARVGGFGLPQSEVHDSDLLLSHQLVVDGRVDPEYFITGHLTDKSDVYSFGVVLLEVLCARPVLMASDRTEEQSLPYWVIWQHGKGQFEEVIDPVLKGTINSRSLRVFSGTAMKCLGLISNGRPVIREVLWDLELALELQRSSSSKELPEDKAIDPTSE